MVNLDIILQHRVTERLVDCMLQKEKNKNFVPFDSFSMVVSLRPLKISLIQKPNHIL